MKTVTVQIGNFDDKLTQAEWSQFVGSVGRAINLRCRDIHFLGFSGGGAPWQHAAWVFTIGGQDAQPLKAEIILLRQAFKQDSVAWTEGETQLV